MADERAKVSPRSEAERPVGLSTNFQREVQAMLFLLNWHCTSREEIRLNLNELGYKTIDDPKPLPSVPDVQQQIPYDDSYPLVELHDVPDDVLAFIDEQKVPEEVLAELPDTSFSSVEALVRAIGNLAATAGATSQDGDT